MLKSEIRGGFEHETGYKFALVLAAGLALGAAAESALHAQPTKVALGYVIAEVEVNDPAAFQPYRNAVPGTLTPFGGRFAVRGGKVTPGERPS